MMLFFEVLKRWWSKPNISFPFFISMTRILLNRKIAKALGVPMEDLVK